MSNKRYTMIRLSLYAKYEFMQLLAIVGYKCKILQLLFQPLLSNNFLFIAIQSITFKRYPVKKTKLRLVALGRRISFLATTFVVMCSWCNE